MPVPAASAELKQIDQTRELLSLQGVSVQRGDRRVLHELDLQVGPAGSVAVVGPSGSGKTTLLHVACGLLPADRGIVEVCGQRLGKLSEAKLADLRLNRIGVVFQFGDLLPELTLQENVELPMRFARSVPSRAIPGQARELLAELGIAELSDQRPDSVSGGERQRAGVARALANAPEVVLADEPTGSLDPSTAQAAIATLLTAVSQRQAALVLVTHNPAIAAMMDRRFVLTEGSLR